MTFWHTFLSSQGAVFEDNRLQSFGQPRAELQAAGGQNILTDLSHLGILEISGEDAVTFLQGQVTNDVKQLNGQISHYTGYCSPKGRLLALFLAFAHTDHLHLQMPLELIEPISNRLKMYVMRSKVSIVDKSSEILCFGLAGPDAEKHLQALFGQSPHNAHDLITLDNATLLRLTGATPRFLVFTKATHAEQIWQSLANSAIKVGKPVWDWLEIQAGIPQVVTATQEAFVPQMLNLDRLNGINFKKGCYTGQEIVARTHYLGKIKRRTLLAHIQANTSPQAGDHLQLKGLDEAIGQIVSAAPSPQGGFDMLAEVRLESLEGESAVVTWQQHALSFKELPYPLN
jgi:folate-binding protein YgfZ